MRNTRRQRIPDVAAQILAGRVVQAGNVVQQMVIEAAMQLCPAVIQNGKVHQPARARIDRPSDLQLHAVTVPVNASALVTRGNPRQVVRGLKEKLFFQLDDQSGESLARHAAV